MKNRTSKWFMCLMVVVALFMISACGNKSTSKSADGTVEFRIGYQVIPNAELLAKATKMFEEKFEGVKVKLVQFEAAVDVNTAMAAGEIDAGLIGSSSVASGVAQNLPYKVIWLHDVIGDNEALVVKKDSGIKSLQDVVGKKIAVSFGSTTHYSLLSALKLKGIDQNKITILDMKPADMLAAWKQGQIDGGYVWYPTLGEMVADGDILLTSRDLAQDGILTADVGIATKDFIENHPDVLKQYIKILDEAVQLYRSSTDEAAEAMKNELNVSKDETTFFMDQLIWLDAKEQASEDYLGTSDKKGAFAKALKDTAEFLKTQKAINTVPDLKVYEDAIEPKFLQKD
ncbi:MetQ/NlpA family ABC transporter substrate-binding protein [Bacillus sp. S/N-304-OC-R1]|uniref:taurine ABC transporter substrate-binding protein n=1 Tax=Bacillus sp. S/N-304-OC-R1 TaxID=2758034 RepID=UPI001C8DCAC9|nr:MetQ/NlpA family ABC transporter substrate-binding protein [Bacillus sp. S/N-304-OC-R1]MBY0123821.1 ABC transporter substrate-binding protein [Bacillus sp. S/N-304-OC-R1]